MRFRFRVRTKKAAAPIASSAHTPGSWVDDRVARPREAEWAWIVCHPEIGEAGAALAWLLESMGSRRR